MVAGGSDLPWPLLVHEGLRWSLGDPYFGEQHDRSNLACVAGEYCAFLRLREGDETGVRQRRGLLVSVCSATFTPCVVCVPRVVEPFVWHAASRI